MDNYEALTEALYQRVSDEFERLFAADKELQRLYKLVETRQATYKDAHAYSARLGEVLRQAFSTVTTDDLPDGQMYFSIATRVVGDHIRRSDEMVIDACTAVQSKMNEDAGFGIKPIKPKSREDTIQAVVHNVSALETYSPEALDTVIDFATWNLQTANAFMKDNADFLTKAGCSMMIIRTYEGKHYDPHRKHGSMQDCKFCQERATSGWIPYTEADQTEIYRRHNGCRCMVTTKFNDKLNSAWTNKTGNMTDMYNAEQKRLRELDSMTYEQRYEELRRQKRARDKGRKR